MYSLSIFIRRTVPRIDRNDVAHFTDVQTERAQQLETAPDHPESKGKGGKSKTNDEPALIMLKPRKPVDDR